MAQFIPLPIIFPIDTIFPLYALYHMGFNYMWRVNQIVWITFHVIPRNYIHDYIHTISLDLSIDKLDTIP